MKITKQDIEKLALLSRIEMLENQIEALRNKLESVLNYASGLAKVSNQSPTLDLPHNVNVMRKDEVISTDVTLILEQAPEVTNNFFVVPKIIKSE